MRDEVKKRPFLIPGLIGIAVILVSVLSLVVFPQTAPGQIEGIRSPIIAFEFAETVDEINLLFGPAGSPERADMVRKMDQGNKLDFLYMLLYSGFLVSFVIDANKQRHMPLFYVAVGLALLAFVGDILENSQLFQITNNLASSDFVDALTRLHWFTWLKWGSLAFYFSVMGVWFLGNGRFGKLIAAVSELTFLLGLFAFAARGFITELFSLSVALTFLLMIIFCFMIKTNNN
jgi:hypothetical protein